MRLEQGHTSNRTSAAPQAQNPASTMVIQEKEIPRDSQLSRNIDIQTAN